MIPLLAQLEFAAPSRLIVLVLLPAIAWVALRGRRNQPAGQLLSSTALRSLVVALLVFAWAAPSFRQARDRRFVVFAIDESASCAADLKRSGTAYLEQALKSKQQHQVRWITFADQPGRIESGDPVAALQSASGQPSTDVAATVRLAQAACPAGYVPQVVLLSDGRQTRGNLLSAAAASTTPISVVPLTAFADPEVAIETIDAPSRVSLDASSIDIAVTIMSNYEGTVAVKLDTSGDGEVKESISVKPGATIWRTSVPLSGANLRGDDPTDDLQPTLLLEATVSSKKDTHSQNNTLSAIVLGDWPLGALIVEADEGTQKQLASAIAQRGIEVKRSTPRNMPESADDLRSFGLVVLANVSAAQLGPQRLAAIDQYVRQGGGLIVVGGERVFGADAYELTPLEKTLPVVATQQPVEQQKSLALVLVVDKSKSMERENRLGLAKEAAKKVAEVLDVHDQVGVLAFGSQSEWISRLAPLSNKEEVLARIDKLQAEGLTDMYPALERAYLSLSQADADSRHAILLTDGVPKPGDFDDVARRMAAAGISISTISLSKGADQTILKDIARIANGVHHHVDDPGDLPRIIERETRSAASQVTQNKYPVQVHRKLPGLDLSRAPLLDGYVATAFKPGAQLILTAGEADPLLAWWRYGRGEAMVLTADLGSSVEAWRKWHGYAQFWQRLAAHAARRRQPEAEELFVRQRDGHVTVSFDAQARPQSPATLTEDGNVLLLVTKLVDREAQESVLEMPQVRPGIYETTFTATPSTAVLLDVGRRSGESNNVQPQLGFFVRYPEEYRLRNTDEQKLKTVAAATGGVFDPKPDDIFAADGRAVDFQYLLWPYALMFAVLVFLADVALRRTSAKQSQEALTEKRKAA